MEVKMNIYEKMINVKMEFLQERIGKSGANRTMKYFELSDIIPIVMPLFHKYKLVPVIRFSTEEAHLEIIDCEDPDMDTIMVTSPMSSCKLPNAHDVQNLGAVQTYLRRYLYMALLDVVEQDQVDNEKSGFKPNGSFKKEEAVNKSSDLACSKCSKEVTKGIATVSSAKFGKILCISCQEVNNG